MEFIISGNGKDYTEVFLRLLKMTPENKPYAWKLGAGLKFTPKVSLINHDDLMADGLAFRMWNEYRHHNRESLWKILPFMNSGRFQILKYVDIDCKKIDFAHETTFESFSETVYIAFGLIFENEIKEIENGIPRNS